MPAEFSCGFCLPRTEREKLLNGKPYTEKDWHSIKSNQPCKTCGVVLTHIFTRKTLKENM